MERYAVANGNWSNTATWDGGTLPATTDDVYSNTFTVTIDSSRTAAKVTNKAGVTAAAGGGFTLAAGVTFTGNVDAGAATCVTFSAASPNIGTIIGNVTVATATLGAVRNSSSGRLNITGNVSGGTGGNALGAYQSSTGRIDITGNVAGGSAAGAHGLRNDGVGSIINVSGTATAGSGLNAHGVYHGGAGTVTVGTAQGNDFGPGSSGVGIAYGVFADNANAAAITRIGAAIDGARGATAYAGAVTFSDLVTATHKVYKSDGSSVTLRAGGLMVAAGMTGGIQRT